MRSRAQDAYGGFLSERIVNDFKCGPAWLQGKPWRVLWQLNCIPPLTTLLAACRYFADLVFKNFGDRIKIWITFNEPQLICDLGYNMNVHAPGVVRHLT